MRHLVALLIIFTFLSCYFCVSLPIEKSQKNELFLPNNDVRQYVLNKRGIRAAVGKGENLEDNEDDIDEDITRELVKNHNNNNIDNNDIENNKNRDKKKNISNNENNSSNDGVKENKDDDDVVVDGDDDDFVDGGDDDGDVDEDVDDDDDDVDIDDENYNDNDSVDTIEEKNPVVDEDVFDDDEKQLKANHNRNDNNDTVSKNNTKSNTDDAVIPIKENVDDDAYKNNKLKADHEIEELLNDDDDDDEEGYIDDDIDRKGADGSDNDEETDANEDGLTLEEVEERQNDLINTHEDLKIMNEFIDSFREFKKRQYASIELELKKVRLSLALAKKLAEKKKDLQERKNQLSELESELNREAENVTSGDADELFGPSDDEKAASDKALNERVDRLQNDILSEENDITDITINSTVEAARETLLLYKLNELNFTETLFSLSLHSFTHSENNNVFEIHNRVKGSIQEIQKSVLRLSVDLTSLDKKQAVDKQETLDDPEHEENKAVDTMGKVKEAADDVENIIHKGDKFEKAQSNEDAKFETVIKLEDDDEPASDKSKPDEQESQIHHLVDSQNNEYVLTRPNDATTHYEDHHFLNDVVMMICSSFTFGLLFHLVRIPSFFGFVVGGIAVGPLGLNLIRSVVQLETIAQFGVFFILFVLGLEFNIEKLKMNFKVSFYGTSMIVFLTVMAVAFIANFLGTTFSAGLLMGCCACLSSTAVVLKVLSAEEIEMNYGQTMISVLVMQDVFFGFMVTLLPLLRADSSTPMIIKQLASTSFSLSIFFTISFFISVPVAHKMLSISSGTKEIFMLCSVFICMFSLALTSYLGISMEMGCFVAGMVISKDSYYAHKTIALIEPVRDLFSCLFFGTIGLHIYPSFLWTQWKLLLAVATGIISIKITITYFILARVLRTNTQVASLTALGLSQISEFGFVVASKGKGLGIISREEYYILLGVTTLSLAMVPFIFNVYRKYGSKINQRV